MIEDDEIVLYFKEIFEEDILPLNDENDKAVNTFFSLRVKQNEYISKLREMIKRYYPQYEETLKMYIVFS